MRTLKLLTTFAIISFFLSSCDKETENIGLLLSYLPLETGNYWKLEHSEKIEITGTKTINNKLYYILESQDNSSYYRIENEKVYVIEANEEEAIKFDLSAEVNESWNFNPCIVTLVSKTDSVTINDQVITGPDQASEFFRMLAEGGEVSIQVRRSRGVRHRSRQINLNIE